MSIAATIDGELMFPSNYIGAADLKGKDVTLTIANVQRDELMVQGGKKEVKNVIYFEKTPKMLVLNKTNAKTILALYGSEAKAWVGSRVTLYPTETRGKEGKLVPCVRIRELVPPAPQAAKAVEPTKHE